MMDTINNENLDQWLFQSVEKQLNPQEAVLLNDYLEVHPEDHEIHESWQSANFEGIEIETYPKLDALLKSKSPWWEKGWFIYNSIVVIALIGLFYCFQTPESTAKLRDLSIVERSLRVKKENALHFAPYFLSNTKTVDQNLMALSELSSSEIEHKRVEIFLDEPEITGIKSPANGDTESMQKIVGELSPKKAIMLNVLPNPKIVAHRTMEKTIDSQQTRQERRKLNKRERKFKRNTRKRENKIYEQSIRNGSDPLIIPLNDFGF